MTNRDPRLIPTLLLGAALAVGAVVSAPVETARAQAIQKETVGIAFTGEVTAVDAKAGTVSAKGANGEQGTFHVDAKMTTILSGDQKVELSALHVGEWISISADTQKGRQVATYIEVVEDASGGGPAKAVATAAGATVEVRHNKLTPAVVQLRAGQSVTFHNLDEMPGGHTVMASDGSFSSPPLAKDQSWSHSFDVPGIYPVRIKEHPAAEASIVVEAAD